MDKILLIVGEKIKKKRTEAGISQTELAKKARVSRMILYRLEKGKIENINLKTLIRISEALNTEIWYFFIPSV